MERVLQRLRGSALGRTLGNEDGIALVIAMLLLLSLTALGSAALMTSSVESKISGNDLLIKQTFYSADAGGTQALQWLHDKGAIPDPVSGGSATVKSYGDGSSSNDKDGVDYDGALSDTNYRFSVAYGRNALVAGSSAQYRQFFYDVNSQAAASGSSSGQVATIMSKVYRIDY